MKINHKATRYHQGMSKAMFLPHDFIQIQIIMQKLTNVKAIKNICKLYLKNPSRLSGYFYISYICISLEHAEFMSIILRILQIISEQNWNTME